MWVVGFGSDGHIYVLDGVKDKLNLTERAEKLHALYVKWMPNIVGYEQYGLQADIPYIKEREQRDWHTSMPIQPLGGKLKKEDRIKTLIPKFQNGEILLPRTLPYINYEHKSICVINEFLKEQYNYYSIVLSYNKVAINSGYSFPMISVMFSNTIPTVTTWSKNDFYLKFIL